MSDEKPLPSHEAAGGASASLGLPPTESQGEQEEEAAVGRTPLERAADAAEELYRLRDTFFPRDPAEKTAALRACADSALAPLDALPPGAPPSLSLISIACKSQPILLIAIRISDTGPLRSCKACNFLLLIAILGFWFPGRQFYVAVIGYCLGNQHKL
jgi:hypothetical protein